MRVAKRPGVVWLIVVGAFVAALGIFALALPYVAGTAVAMLVGAALVIAGVGEIVFFVRGREASFPFHPAEAPVDAGIVGIVDHWEMA